MGLFSIFLVGSGTASCFGAAKASCCFVGQQFRQRADDAVGLDRGARGQAVAMDVDPDRVDAEPLDALRKYLTTYAFEQAFLHLSDQLIANLEKHWNARQRKL